MYLYLFIYLYGNKRVYVRMEDGRRKFRHQDIEKRQCINSHVGRRAFIAKINNKPIVK